MIGGGGRRTGAGARRLSIEMDRNELRLVVEFETAVGDVVCVVCAGLAGVMDSLVATAAAAAAAADDDDDAEFSAAADDVTLAAASCRCLLSDVIGFCAEVETDGVEVAAALARWLPLRVAAACDVTLCVVVVATVGR